MLKSKRGKLGLILTCILSLSLMGAALVACSPSHDGEVKVTFYDGDTVITEKWVEKDGTLEEFTPADVGYEKGEGFTFFDWFSTKNYTFDMEWDEPIAKDKNVYSAWYSDEEDTRTWTIAGESPAGGPLKAIGWNGGLITEGENKNVLTKTEGKNEYTFTINLYSGDKFQFCVQNEKGVWASYSDGTTVARGGQFFESDENFEISKDALAGGDQNIVVLKDGNYTFTVTTDMVDRNIGVITYVRNGDAPEIVLEPKDYNWYIYGASAEKNDDSALGAMNWGEGYADSSAIDLSKYVMLRTSNNVPDGTGTWIFTGDFLVGDEFGFAVLQSKDEKLIKLDGTFFNYSSVTDFNGTEANFEKKGTEGNIGVKTEGTYTFAITVSKDTATQALKASIEIWNTKDYLQNEAEWAILGNRLTLAQITNTEGGTEKGNLGMSDYTQEQYDAYDSDVKDNNFGSGTNVLKFKKNTEKSVNGTAVFELTVKLDVGDYFYFCVPVTVWDIGRYKPDENYSYVTAGYNSKVAPSEKNSQDLCSGLTNVWKSNYVCTEKGTYTFTLTVNSDGECSVTAVANS